MIGVIGASGKIGSEIVKALNKFEPEIKTKLGCRQNIEKYIGNWATVDINNSDSLKSFSEDCKLIINASGVAIKNQLGVPVIEVGDDEYYKDLTCEDNSVIYGCGAVPGVIGLLPRKIAEEFDCVKSMRIHYLINEALTMTAALDMTTSFRVNNNKSSVTQTKCHPEKMPFLGDTVYKYRFVDTESKEIDKLLDITDSEWFMLRNSDDFEQLFSRTYESREKLAEQICKLSKIQQLGVKNSISFLLEMTGVKDEREKVVSTYAQSESPAALSGKACASAAIAFYKNKISNGVYRMSLCKEWKEIWSNLETMHPFDTFVSYPYSLKEMEIDEEGEL